MNKTLTWSETYIVRSCIFMGTQGRANRVEFIQSSVAFGNSSSIISIIVIIIITVQTLGLDSSPKTLFCQVSFSSFSAAISKRKSRP